MPEAAAADRFLMCLDAVCQAVQPDLSQLQAGILASSYLGIAEDSRTFARIFGLAHALILRATNELCDRALLDIVSRDTRTQRTFWHLSPRGETLINMTKQPKRPRDTNQLGKLMVDIREGDRLPPPMP